jgi:hypothetical protein
MANLTKILELAQLRTDELTIAGTTIYLVEPGALDLVEHRAISGNEYANDKETGKRRMIKEGDRITASALLIERCCFTDPEHKERAFTKQEALAVAKGSPRVALLLLNKLLQWAGEEDDEDKSPKDGAPNESSSLS